MRIPFTKYAIKRFNLGLEQQYAQCAEANDAMAHRSHARFHIINALLKHTHQRRDLEIGVRNPADNFDRIAADFKGSVDPGVEAQENLAIFPLTRKKYALSKMLIPEERTLLARPKRHKLKLK